MKVGDLVNFNPKANGIHERNGTLTAVKHFTRVFKQIEGLPGIILQDCGNTAYVAFGEKLLLLNKEYLEVVNESR